MKFARALVALSLSLVKAAFALVFGTVVAALILTAIPLWLLEMALSKGAFSSARLASLRDCDSPLDWMFSRVDPKGRQLHESFVRLLGLEFRYC